ncbi:hypothetical protein PG994_005464 [Apiospora phragmitis]|uniref:ABC transporter domain-containing protein n=1 Tax=Apiospora phragmitis TaxID=2905665 RepID=A0ABR1VCB0_9PEZI
MVAIELRNVSVSYDGENMTLRNVSFIADQKQKIGILGRTGSGKSTLVSTLLRLIDIAIPPSAEPGASSQAGQIIIDGLSIETVPRETLRSRILAIPQESILLQGSVRYNLDPTNIATGGGQRINGR